MKKLLALAFLLAGIATWSEAGFAFLSFGKSSTGIVAPANLTLPQIVGLDTVGSTLQLTPGTYSGSPATLTYSWHMIGGSSLGTGPTFGPLTSGMVSACTSSTDPACGRIQVDETATNTAGAVTVTSQFVGPVETALPRLSFMIIGTGLGSATVTIGGVTVTSITSQTATNIQGLIPVGAPFPTTANTTVSSGTMTTAGFGALNLSKALPTYPAHYLQNGHAVCPGCDIPPAAPTTSPTHIWYFDGVAGGTQTSGKTGHAGSPFANPNAIFATTAGYNSGTAPLFPSVIQPGDLIYIKGGQTYSPKIFLNPINQYSTSTLAINGSLLWTWIEGDPAGSTPPVLSGIHPTGGAGFIFKGLNVENNGTAAGTGFSGDLLQVSGSSTNPVYDILFENISASSWIGHSNDPWYPSTYPTSGGHFDGTIQTASPYVGNLNAVPAYSASATTSDPHKLFFTSSGMPIMGSNANAFQVVYVWPTGYYYQQAFSGRNTGIPPGTKLVDYNGVANVSYQGTATASVILAKTVVLNQGWQASDTDDFYVGCQEPNPAVLNCTTGTSLIWANQGSSYMTIGPCDPVTDAATGCPSANYVNPNGGGSNGTPFVGCDPLVTALGTGGCPAGTAPAWNGVTRNIAGESLQFTQYMVVEPSGWWNHLDWIYSYQAVNMVGGFGSNNIDPSNPNDVVGLFGISVKDSTFRNINNGWAFGAAHDSVVYNNKFKYTPQDMGDIYSSHRIIAANNYMSDFTFELVHPDIVQFALLGGGGVTEETSYYGNSLVDNEGYTITDNTDPFVDFTQPISDVTDSIYSNTYVVNNININSLAPMNTGGLYNVYAHNDVLSEGGFGWMSTTSGAKASSVYLTQPQFTLLANNIANSFSRPSGVRWFTATGSGFGSTAGTITVAGLPVQAIISWSTNTITATIPGTFGTITPTVGNIVVSSGTVTGTTNSTAATNCKADQVTMEGNMALPAINWTTGALSIPFSNACGSTGNPLGTSNFLQVTGPLTGQSNWSLNDWRTEVSGANSPFMEYHPLVPGGNSPGAYLAATPCLQNNVDVGSCGPIAGPGIMNLRLNPSFVSSLTTPYQPPLIGGGANLGIAGPPATHDRAPETNPPNVGVY